MLDFHIAGRSDPCQARLTVAALKCSSCFQSDLKSLAIFHGSRRSTSGLDRCFGGLIIPAGILARPGWANLGVALGHPALFDVPLKTGELCGSVPKMFYWPAHCGSPRERIHTSSSKNGRATGMEAGDWRVSPKTTEPQKQCFIKILNILFIYLIYIFC